MFFLYQRVTVCGEKKCTLKPQNDTRFELYEPYAARKYEAQPLRHSMSSAWRVERYNLFKSIASGTPRIRERGHDKGHHAPGKRHQCLEASGFKPLVQVWFDLLFTPATVSAPKRWNKHLCKGEGLFFFLFQFCG